jgi:hypothetical protein
MKLYKQLIHDERIVQDPVLIIEEGMLEDLKREAQRLAALDGCIEYAWVTGKDSNPEFQFPYELTVNDTYRFIIREW